jgi:hypothetical protein
MKSITCPAHPNGRVKPWSLHKHKAVLWEHGEKWAGIWECLITGESDACEHENRVVESVEVTFWSSPDVDSSYDVLVYVCTDCGVAIDRDEGDPEQDRFDAMVDAQIDYARDK